MEEGAQTHLTHRTLLRHLRDASAATSQARREIDQALLASEMLGRHPCKQLVAELATQALAADDCSANTPLRQQAQCLCDELQSGGDGGTPSPTTLTTAR